MAPGTWRDYETHGRLRLKPELGGKRLSQITRDHVEDLIDDWFDDGLAPKTINNALTVLKVFLNWCVSRDPPYLSRSPAAGVEPVAAEHVEMDFLRGDEVSRYIAGCSPEYRPLAHFLIGTGCRISEALAVEWDDIDSEHRVVRILRQERKGAEGRRGRARRSGAAATKGKRYRSVHISPQLVRVLAELRARREVQIGTVAGDSKVFVSFRASPVVAPPVTAAARERWLRIAEDVLAVDDGREAWTQAEIATRRGVSQQTVSRVHAACRAGDAQPISRDLVSRSWHHAALTAAGIDRPLRLHDLRHTAAARWLQRESLYFVQRQLGHADIQTTARHYGHLEREHVYARLADLDDDLLIDD